MATGLSFLKKQIMTLYLGICLLTLGWTANAEAIPERIIKTIDRLHRHYLQNNEKLYSGHPVFLGKLKALDEKFEEGEQKFLMTVILDAYDRIFTQMQNETQDNTVKDDLKEVKDQLSKLKKHYYSGKHADLKSYVTELLDLKETNPLNQLKALFELKSVYRDASKLAGPSPQNHRRRRQAKHSKKQRSKLN